jgi:hypothetical protein
MQRNVDAGLAARRSTFPDRVLRRLRRPRRITVYLGVLDALARVFDAASLLRRARRGPWRAEVAEESMVPALQPGDWLLLDPTCRRWPRPGSIVVVREPVTGILAIKRVAARGARAAAPPDGLERSLGRREAWVLGDARDGSVDSRRYGPLDADDLVARAWFRYGPPRRIGRLR